MQHCSQSHDSSNYKVSRAPERSSTEHTMLGVLDMRPHDCSARALQHESCWARSSTSLREGSSRLFPPARHFPVQACSCHVIKSFTFTCSCPHAGSLHLLFPSSAPEAQRDAIETSDRTKPSSSHQAGSSDGAGKPPGFANKHAVSSSLTWLWVQNGPNQDNYLG